MKGAVEVPEEIGTEAPNEDSAADILRAVWSFCNDRQRAKTWFVQLG